MLTAADAAPLVGQSQADLPPGEEAQVRYVCAGFRPEQCAYLDYHRREVFVA